MQISRSEMKIQDMSWILGEMQRCISTLFHTIYDSGWIKNLGVKVSS